MNKGRINGVLPFEHIFGFCKTNKKITKQLGFHQTFKTADLQEIVYKTLGDDIGVDFDNLFLFVPIFITDGQTKKI